MSALNPLYSLPYYQSMFWPAQKLWDLHPNMAYHTLSSFRPRHVTETHNSPRIYSEKRKVLKGFFQGFPHETLSDRETPCCWVLHGLFRQRESWRTCTASAVSRVTYLTRPISPALRLTPDQNPTSVMSEAHFHQSWMASVKTDHFKHDMENLQGHVHGIRFHLLGFKIITWYCLWMKGC